MKTKPDFGEHGTWAGKGSDGEIVLDSDNPGWDVGTDFSILARGIADDIDRHLVEDFIKLANREVQFIHERFPSMTVEYMRDSFCRNMRFCPMRFIFIDCDGEERTVFGSRCWEWLKENPEMIGFVDDKSIYENAGDGYIIVWDLERNRWQDIPLARIIDFRLTKFNGLMYFK